MPRTVKDILDEPWVEALRNGHASAHEQRHAAVMVERFVATITKLPTTADGVPVVPGMEVWHASCNVPVHSSRVRDILRNSLVCDQGVGRLTLSTRAESCYSTQAAAEAAQKGAHDGE